MNHRATAPSAASTATFSLALACAVAVAGGCASKQKIAATGPVPIDLQTLDQIEPRLTLSQPTTRRSQPASGEALQLYAQGRDALLSNRKKQAIEKLSKAAERDPYSAITYRDIGYAYLGTDADRAMEAFRRAVELDPGDVDSRVQVSRLLLDKKDVTTAADQLRLAQLGEGYKESEVDAAVVDYLLGRVLVERGYTRAAIECFERVLPAVDRGAIELRVRPELGALAAKPASLKLRIADLSVTIGDFDRALALYEQIRIDEPSAAGAVDLRVIHALAHKGEMDAAASQMLELVDRYDASRTSIDAYIELFADHGGDAAALAAAKKATASPERRVLQARLLRRLGKPADAVTVLSGHEYSTAFVRETVLSYRDAGRSAELPQRLLQMMLDTPTAWPAISRGWSILTQTMQPSPLDVRDLQQLKVSAEFEAARQFVLGRVAIEQGQPALARDSLAKALASDGPRVRIWNGTPYLEPPPDIDYGSEQDLQRFIEEYTPDAQYLGLASQFLVKEGQNAQLQAALQAVVERSPGNLPAMVQLVALLQLADRKPEALRLIDRAGAELKSASELYQLSALLTQLGELPAAEKMLRRAHETDAHHPATCNDLGYFLTDAGRELDFAESLLWRAVGMEPENPAYVDSLGWLLYKRGKFDQAQQYLDQALAASDPPDPVVLDHAADAAYRTSKQDKARQYWEQAIAHIKQQGSNDPQLRLKIEHKLRQLTAGQNVDVAATGQ